MANEIELKLALPESAQRLLLRHPLLKRAKSRDSGRLINLYYDTPSLELHRAGIALRLRRQGGQWLQTVKCAGVSVAGLSSRPEWEDPYGGEFDFSAVDDETVRRRLERLRERGRLAPVFETNFLRTTWRMEPEPGVALLLALDRGWTAAAGRREAISEIEIEIATGEARHVFDLARQIAESIPLAPAPFSKAERGYRLFRGDALAPAKAGEVALAANLSPLEGFRRIAFACLDHLQRNHEGAATSDDPEYIHQMRVATRRLRAALRLFKPLLPPALAATLLPPLRERMALLGAARDMDVLLSEIAAPVMNSLAGEPRLAALVGVVTEHRHRQRQEAVRDLRSARFGQFMLLAGELLHRPPFDASAVGGTESLATFADVRVRKLRKKVRRLAQAANTDDPASLHALRIGIKRLRYALEFFAPLARRKLAKTLDRLTRLQDTLGQINDLANAGRLLTDCASEDSRLREAVTLIGGWHGPRYTELLAAVPKELARLHGLKLPKFASNNKRPWT